MTENDIQKHILGPFIRQLAQRYLLLEAGLAQGVDDLTKSEFQILELIVLGDITTVSQIANLGKVPMSTASWLANQLVDKQYLVRQRDPNDRRVVQLALTDKAKRVLAVLEGAFDAMALELWTMATPDEQKMLVQIAQRFVQ